MTNRYWFFVFIIGFNVWVIAITIHRANKEADIAIKKLIDRSAGITQASRDAIDS